MSAFEKVLLPGEEVVYRARLSSLPLIVDGLIVTGGLVMVIAGLLLVGMVVVGFGLMGVGGIVLMIGIGRLVRTMVQRGTTDMVVTSRRVLSRVGVLTKESEEMFLGKIESVEVQQSLWARMLNYGSIEINGSGEGELVFINVQSPHDFRKACLGAVEQTLRGGGSSSGPAGGAVVGKPGVVFEVRVQDRPGAEARWIEVRAESAEKAQALAAAAGVTAGEARLKRIG